MNVCVCVCVCVISFDLFFLRFPNFYVCTVTCPADTDGREAARRQERKSNKCGAADVVYARRIDDVDSLEKAADPVASTRQII